MCLCFVGSIMNGTMNRILGRDFLNLFCISLYMGSVNKGSSVCDIGLFWYGLIDVGADDLLVDEVCVQDKFQIFCNINVGVETGMMV